MINVTIEFDAPEFTLMLRILSSTYFIYCFDEGFVEDGEGFGLE